MNLLGANLYDPAVAVSKATSALLAMTALDTTNLRVAVTVPAHGMLHFVLKCTLEGATTFPQILLGVMNGATVVGRVTPQITINGTALATTRLACWAEFTATGLTPGAMNLDAAYGVEILLAATNIKYGGPNDTTTDNAWGAFAFEVYDPRPLPTAAPAAIGGILVAPTTANVGLADVSRINGAAVSVPATAGILDVNVKNMNNVAATPITTIKAVQGLTTADTIATVSAVTGLTAANLDAAVSTRLATSGYSAAPSAATITAAVWNEALGGHLTSGTTGNALNGAGAAGDPWGTVLPGAYGDGTAGSLIGNKIGCMTFSLTGILDVNLCAVKKKKLGT